MILKIILLIIALISPFSGFSDERIRPVFVLEEGETYSEKVVDLFIKHPEMARFILEYPLYHNGNTRIDLTKEVEKGKIPLFLQWDKRWGYKTYGSNFLAMTGCGPTCLSMVYCGLTGDTEWNPYKMARMAEEYGFYVPGVGTAWDLFESGAEMLGLQREEAYIDSAYIQTRLQAGMVIVCSMLPGDFTNAGHFIVLTGTDGNGNISVRDPNSRRKSEVTWHIDRLIPQIKGIWAYK